jgi:hypothetical protein
MEITPEAKEVINLMFTIVKYAVVILTIHLCYSLFEFVRHWWVDGMEYHTRLHGLNALVSAYLWVCCYPATRVVFWQ